MKILKRMFGRKGEVIDDPVALRDRLFEAVARNDRDDLAALCRANRDTIRLSYAAWLTPPPEWFGSDPRRVDWYGRNLLAIGQCFARELGDSSLLQQLQRPAQEGPFREWGKELRECSEMMRTHDFEGALTGLSELLPKIRNFVGFDAKRMEGLVVGHIGFCLHQTLRPEEALACFEEATALCAEARDDEGVVAQLGNRIETLRWLGRHHDAAPWVEQLAARHEANGKPVEAARYRTRARIMAEGEPLLRVLFAIGDRVYEEEEVPVPIVESVKILYERNRLTLVRCEERLEQGGRLMAQDRYEEALASFASAGESDPYAPRPHYESGAIHLLSGRYDRAIECYERTERLAPGWFVVRSELWLARQLAAGRFHAEVPRMLSSLEQVPPENVVEFAQAIVHRFEDLPQAWLALAEGLQRLDRKADAEAAYRRGLACAEDEDVRTRLLTSLGTAAVPPRRAELEQAAALSGHLVAGATARLLLKSESAG